MSGNTSTDVPVALVSGAGGGIGGGVVEALAHSGARVVAADLNVDRARQVAARLAGDGLDTDAVELVLGDRESEADVVDKILRDHGRVDILVNITGGPAASGARNVAGSEWIRYFNEMILSVIHLTDLLIPQMIDRGWGRIITSSSSGSLEPIKGLGVSNTLRPILHGWSKTLATEVARFGITSNVVVPGRIASRRAVEMDAVRAAEAGISVDEMHATLSAAIPAGRYGTPREYGDVVTFLASREASYITGSVLRIDGGKILSA